MQFGWLKGAKKSIKPVAEAIAPASIKRLYILEEGGEILRFLLMREFSYLGLLKFGCKMCTVIVGEKKCKGYRRR